MAECPNAVAPSPPAPAAGAPKAGRPRRLLWLRRWLAAAAKWFYANALVVILAPWVVGQVLRDRFHLTGMCLFLPSPAVAAVLLAVALVAWLATFRRAALAAALLALAPLVMTLVVENRWTRPPVAPPAGKTLRMVHWNVNAGHAGWYELIACLRDQKADIYVLSEAFGEIGVAAFRDTLGPGYHMEAAHSLVVLVRGTVTRPSAPRIRGRAYFFQCMVDGTPISLLVADLPSLPVIDRAPFLRQVRSLADETDPDLIVGDFNAPRRSYFLSHLPLGYVHAYYAAGKGWSYTWPAQLPLWAIDQCIVGPRLQPLRYDLVTTNVSDHRMQVLDFAVRKQE